MDKTIKLRVKKDMNNKNEFKVLKFKGTLISKGFTKLFILQIE